MNKKELIAAIAQNCGTTQAQAGEFLNAFCDTVVGQLKQSENVVIPGFGQFISKHRPSREVRIPGTDRTTMSKAKTVAQFKPSAGLKDL